MAVITQEFISYKKCLMEKWSISNIEEVRFFREIHKSVAPSIMEINKIFTEVFLFLTSRSDQ